MTISTLSIFTGGDGRPPTSIPATAPISSQQGAMDILLGALTSSTTSASTQTPLDITASSGVLEYVGISCTTALTASLLKITIDGLVVYNETGALGTTSVKNAIGGGSGNSPDTATASLVKMPFNISAKIEFASDGTNTAKCIFRDYLT